MKLTPHRVSLREGLWWDLAFVGVIAFTTIMVIVGRADGEPHWAAALDVRWQVGILVAPNLLLFVLYCALGRRTILLGMRGEAVSPLGYLFLVILLLILFISVICDPAYAMLQVLAYPVVWSVFSGYRDSVIWCLAVAASVGVGMFIGLMGDGVEDALLRSSATAAISLVFSLAMGTWISHIHAQGETYRRLAEELRRSQDEVSALSKSAGASAERERLSRDLHDTLTQTLTGLVMLSEQAERALDVGDQERARQRLARVQAASRSAVAEARALVATTQPIGDAGLLSAIERVAAALRADTEVHVECSLEQVSLTREHEVVLLRAVQEGIANARKHAQAQRLTVQLSAEADGGARLIVEDDGVGPGTGAREGGFGLTGLADRVCSAGGTMRFGSGTEGGSRLEVVLNGTQSEGSKQVVCQSAGHLDDQLTEVNGSFAT